MKFFKNCIGLLALTLAVMNAGAQKVKLSDGDIAILKDEKSINIEYTYKNMAVGKFDTEKEYVEHKVEEYNKKEPGKGDSWAKSWVADRESRFEPKFNELFEKESEMSVSKTAKYTLIVNTIFTEPGYNIVISRKNASINCEIKLVETANKNKTLATFTIDKSPGRTFGGYDYDTGLRIGEAYAAAGKALGKYIKKKS